jgi:hypothetical protein
VCFAKQTLSKHNLVQLGLKPISSPLNFFLLGWIWLNASGLSGIQLAQPRHLPMPGTRRGEARVNLLKRAWYSPKVINFLHTVLKGEEDLKGNKQWDELLPCLETILEVNERSGWP